MEYTVIDNIHVYEHEDISIRYNPNTKSVRVRTQNKDIRRVNKNNVEEDQFIKSLLDEFSDVEGVLEHLIKDYLAYYTPRRKKGSMIGKERYCSYVQKYFNFNPHKIDRLDIIKGLGKVQEEHSADTRNRVLKEFRLLIDHGIEHGFIKERYNILRNIKLVEVPKNEKRLKSFFELQSDVEDKSQHTIQRLLSVAESPQERLLIILLANTGARIMEIMRLKWSDIYWHETVGNDGTWVVNLKNSKTRKGNEEVDGYRQFDLTPAVYNAIMEQKMIIDLHVNQLREEYEKSQGKRNRRYFESTYLEKDVEGYSDSRAKYKWKWIITNKYGNAPGYSCGRNWYHRMWKRAYDKYKDDAHHPWVHGPKPIGLSLHAFRRYYTTEFRDQFNQNNEYTKSHHEKLRQLLGHVVGSPITDKIYTEWDSKRVVDSKLNSVVNIDMV